MRVAEVILWSGLMAASVAAQDAAPAQPIFPAPDQPAVAAETEVPASEPAVQPPALTPAQPEQVAAIEPAPTVEAEAIPSPTREQMESSDPANNTGPTLLTAPPADNTAAASPTKGGRSLDAYRTIIERNPFGLKDPPVAPPPDQGKAAPPEKKTEFYLTGISTVGYPRFPKMAYLMNKDPQKKEYSEKHISIRLGDRVGDVVLNEIDEQGRRVKITHKSEQLWLSMKENGVPAPAAAPAPGMPGAPGVPGGPKVPGQGMPGQMQATPGKNLSYDNQPSAMPMAGMAGASGTKDVAMMAPNTGLQPSTRRFPRTATVNYGGVGTGGPMDGGAQQPQQPEVEPAQQYLNMLANQKLGERYNIPTPPIPPMPGR